MPDLETVVAPPIQPAILPDEDQEQMTVLAPRYRILIHNDNFTPMEFVVYVLMDIFRLSSELAEHVMMTAHMEGTAVVLIRPRNEAEKLIAIAHGEDRMAGFPLPLAWSQRIDARSAPPRARAK